ncbi:MAG: rhodanese-like domain-containing protein [Brumimicrobium sp.]
MAENNPIIDVREPIEYSMGHAEGTINIPLAEIPEHIEEIKAMENPILCCASGSRSGYAVQWLKSQGIDCENGGSWLNFISQSQ